VDQFVVKALREVTNLPESKTIAVIDENNIQPQEGAVLIEIMQRKARELNELFRELFWTPRKIDMILWTFGRNTINPAIKYMLEFLHEQTRRTQAF
jgi:hypothetical protein